MLLGLHMALEVGGNSGNLGMGSRRRLMQGYFGFHGNRNMYLYLYGLEGLSIMGVGWGTWQARLSGWLQVCK